MYINLNAITLQIVNSSCNSNKKCIAHRICIIMRISYILKEYKILQHKNVRNSLKIRQKFREDKSHYNRILSSFWHVRYFNANNCFSTHVLLLFCFFNCLFFFLYIVLLGWCGFVKFFEKNIVLNVTSNLYFREM